MNSNEPSSEIPPQYQPEPDNTAPPPFLPKLPTTPKDRSSEADPYWFLKWILAQNPFYIASAIFLLYAMFRLSTDSRMFKELSQLFFNFGSFQVYEVMLAVTAIILVRRRILYDFSLLLCIESLFVFVPFLLVTQASLIADDMALIFSVAGCALVLMRFGKLKKYFEGMNFRPRLLSLGGVLLCVNVILPLFVRHVHAGSSALDRDLRLNPLIEVLWLIGMPALGALALLLPTPARYGPHLAQRRTFPMTVLTLWVLVTCAHLYCIGYIHQVQFQDSFVLPIIWTAAWMFYLRRHDIFERVPDRLNNGLLMLPAAATLLASYQHEWTLFFVFNVTNAFGYGAFFCRHRKAVAFQLLALSLAASLSGLPEHILTLLNLSHRRGTWIGVATVAYLLFQAVLSRSAKAGVLGALVAGFAAGAFFEDHRFCFDISLQIGTVFLLVHSLRWTSDEKDAQAARGFAAIVWLVHSMIWTTTGGSTAGWTTACFAAVVVLTYFAVRAIFGAWGSRVVPYTAAAVLLCNPVERLVLLVKDMPMGILVLVASFVLFACGTLLALNRHRWHSAVATVNPESKGNDYE